MKLEAVEMPNFPRLAWFARVQVGRTVVEHGALVERGANWVVEGVWDAPFGDDGFRDSEAFWGSGLVVDSDVVELVPSIAVTDRILYGRIENEWVASNSLSILLARTGKSLDRRHNYSDTSYALKDGMVRYDSRLKLSDDAELHVLYHQHVVLSAASADRELTSQVHEFRNFSDYSERMFSTMERVRLNIESSSRKHPTEVFTTASSGYDSSCASIFARQCGARKCFTLARSNSTSLPVLGRKIRNDSGEDVARALGLTPVYFPSRPSRREVQYRSASCIRPELAFDGIIDHLFGKVGIVFTGFYGDTAWGIDKRGIVDSDLVWPDPSGYSIAEGRLYAGYINVAIPFLFGRSRDSLRRISVSDEMAPWRLNTDYDRPIPRRLLEDAGVDRQLFGSRKKAILNLQDLPTNRLARREFLQWLHDTETTNSTLFLVRAKMNGVAFFLSALKDKIFQLLTGKARFTRRDPLWNATCDPHNLMFIWAVETLVKEHQERNASSLSGT